MNHIKLIGFTILLSFIIVTAKVDITVNVQSPQDLKNFYQYRKMDITLANFGYVPYGKSLIGNVHLADPIEACSPLKPMSVEKGNDPAPILLVKRGGCTFVSKAHYAQLIGAKLVLVIDTIDEYESSVILIDDGYGYDISIPTLMISHYDGEKLLTFANSTNEETRNGVVLSFKFPLPLVNQTVKYELWMSSADVKSYEFLRQFKKYQEQLFDHDQAVFEPHYAVWYCSFCKNNGFQRTNPNCLSNGRYCAPDPDQSGPLSGKDIVIEDLRQICIHKTHPREWWGYMEKFEESCINKTVSDFQKCSENVQRELNIDTTATNKCVQDSFVGGKNMDIDDNTILQRERQLFQGQGIQIWPSLIINNVTFRGNLLPVTGALNAICSSFTTAPDACNLNQGDEDNSGLSTFSVVLIVFFSVSAFMLVAMFFYKRHIRREMNKELQLQVNTAISQYFALSDNKNGRV